MIKERGEWSKLRCVNAWNRPGLLRRPSKEASLNTHHETPGLVGGQSKWKRRAHLALAWGYMWGACLSGTGQRSWAQSCACAGGAGNGPRAALPCLCDPQGRPLCLQGRCILSTFLTGREKELILMKGILTFWQFDLNQLFFPIMKKAVLVFRPFTRSLVVLLCWSGLLVTYGFCGATGTCSRFDVLIS